MKVVVFASLLGAASAANGALREMQTASCPNSLWDMCGGENFKGATCCGDGTVCVFQNDDYSSCQFTGLANNCSNALYAQCGGVNFAGAKCCGQGQCVAFNQYYSQCLLHAPPTVAPQPTPAPTVPTLPPTLPPTPNAQCTNTLWSTCGGDDFTGPTCCGQGTTCVKQNDDYSSCQFTTLAGGCQNKLYAQCGGLNFKGLTCCGQGVCVANGAYYSQCVLPSQSFNSNGQLITTYVNAAETTTASTGSAGGSTAPILGGIAGAVVVLGAALVIYRRRQAQREEAVASYVVDSKQNGNAPYAMQQSAGTWGPAHYQ